MTYIMLFLKRHTKNLYYIIFIHYNKNVFRTSVCILIDVVNLLIELNKYFYFKHVFHTSCKAHYSIFIVVESFTQYQNPNILHLFNIP